MLPIKQIAAYVVFRINLFDTVFNTSVADSWFYSKDEATNFNDHIKNTDTLKSYKYKAKLLGNTVAQLPQIETDDILKMKQLLCC